MSARNPLGTHAHTPMSDGRHLLATAPLDVETIVVVLDRWRP